MNPEQSALWQRIQAHAIDDPVSACPFSLRLAKENHWPPGYTARAIEEYRRFAFLAVAAGHPVSPSDPVDQVWHLHLLYTRDYWGEFCGKVLCTPLHHGPTRGGAAEADKFADWYAATRDSYRRFFGEPPLEFWPERPEHPETARVDLGRHWIVAKRPLFRWFVDAVGWFTPARERRAAKAATTPPASDKAASGLVSAPTAGTALRASAMLAGLLAITDRAEAATHVWPLDLPGPQFLGVFALFALAVFVGGTIWRWKLRLPVQGELTGELDPYEAAQLAEGAQRAFVAALLAATNRGLIEVVEARVKRTAASLPPGLPLIERAVCEAATRDGVEMRTVRRAAEPALVSIEAGLVEKGLVVSEEQSWRVRFHPFFLALSVPALGAAKIVIGLERDRPVAFITVLSIVTFGAAFAFLRQPWRTRFGERVVDELRLEHLRLRDLPPASVGGSDAAWLIPLAVGLWGVNTLHGTPLEDTARHLRPKDDGGAGGFGSGGCGGGSSDSGSSDGGGGSSCGSGCGGCGGGGGD